MTDLIKHSSEGETMNIENLMQTIKEKNFRNITFENKKKEIYIHKFMVEEDHYLLMVHKKINNNKRDMIIHEHYYDNSLNELEMDLNNLFNNKKIRSEILLD